MTQQNNQLKRHQQHNPAAGASAAPGASPVPRGESDEARDVLADEVSKPASRD